MNGLLGNQARRICGSIGLALVSFVFSSEAMANMIGSEEDFPPHERCALCHGLFGDSARDKFPKLGGQRPAYLEVQIRAFLSGTRNNDGGQMAAIVTEITEDDIPKVVAWFSSQEHPEPEEIEGAAAFAETYAELGCASCHTDTANGPEQVPYLAAQHPAYLLKQMTDMVTGARDPKANGGSHQTLAALSNDQLQMIADYLAVQRRLP